jgi:hypothetical protein
MRGRRLVAPIILVAAAEATELLVFANGTGPLRVALGLGFALLAPGWAVVRMLRLPIDLVTWIALAVGVSTAIDIAVAFLLFYLDIWSIELAVTVLTGIIVIVVALDLPIVRHWIRRWSIETLEALSGWRSA